MAIHKLKDTRNSLCPVLFFLSDFTYAISLHLIYTATSGGGAIRTSYLIHVQTFGREIQKLR